MQQQVSYELGTKLWGVHCLCVLNDLLLSSQSDMSFSFSIILFFCCMLVVYVHPPNPVSTTGRENYRLRCLLSTTTAERLASVTWLLNGSSLESLGLDGVSSLFENIGFGISTLTFANLESEYNETTIKCRGTLRSGGGSVSAGVVLLLQGMFTSLNC